jgi:tRNA (mo5U34)-methyltransferase
LLTTRADIERLSRVELLALADQLSWVHRIDLREGYVTDGLWGGGNPEIARAMADIDFAGKRVVDIGCWDGCYSFEAEERGAREVHSTDLISQRDYSALPTFEVARAARRSRAEYHPELSVYDTEALGIDDFDVVIFAGVYYHLKDPLLALTVLRRIMRAGGTILIEGAVCEEPGCFARFYYRQTYCGDNSNWWIPTIECLREWVMSSRFEICREYAPWGQPHNPRHALLAKAVQGADSLYRYPDKRLAPVMRPIAIE